LKRAQEDGKIAVRYYNPRDFAMSAEALAKADGKMTYAERRVDDRPYGGGPGMVMEALPVMRAIERAMKNSKMEILQPVNTDSNTAKMDSNETKATNDVKSKILNKPKRNRPKIKIIFFSPAGEQFSNVVADKFKKYTDIILVCGRYEGIDARVKKAFPMTDISVGPFVLTGGELPAMIVIDAIARRIAGVLGDELSLEESRVASPDVYTRPEVIEFNSKKYRVPKILLSGHHAKMDEWKLKIKQK